MFIYTLKDHYRTLYNGCWSYINAGGNSSDDAYRGMWNALKVAFHYHPIMVIHFTFDEIAKGLQPPTVENSGMNTNVLEDFIDFAKGLETNEAIEVANRAFVVIEDAQKNHIVTVNQYKDLHEKRENLLAEHNELLGKYKYRQR